MDFSFFGTDLLVLLTHYGSFALFILLGMGIFGLPVPEETLIALAGFLIHTGDLAPAPTMISAYLGTSCGVTISYFLGRTAGRSILNQYKKWLPVKSQQLHRRFSWFSHFSKWTLLIGYLIPGLRHFTGLFAGSAAMQFKEFALFAYSGAFLWTLLYLSIGYFWSDWFSIYAPVFQNIEMTMELFTLSLTMIFIIYLIYHIKFR